MPLYVRVRNRSNLRNAIEAVTTQTDVAIATGISLQRVNQLITSPNPVRMRVELASKVEAALGLRPGTMFVADPDVVRGFELIGAYLAPHSDDEPAVTVTRLDDPPPDDTEQPAESAQISVA